MTLALNNPRRLITKNLNQTSWLVFLYIVILKLSYGFFDNTKKKNDFALTKKKKKMRSIRYPITSTQAESKSHSLEQATICIGLYAKKIGLNQDDAIFSINDKQLKLIDQIIYLGSNISYKGL